MGRVVTKRFSGSDRKYERALVDHFMRDDGED
jgi:hypothetical protein